jgi:endoplasmic reticulum resident protein 44
MIGYFESRESRAYENFRKSALNLKDDCKFVAGFGDVVARMHPPGHDIIAFRSDIYFYVSYFYLILFLLLFRNV